MKMNHLLRYNDQLTEFPPCLLAAITVNHLHASRLRYPEVIGEIFEKRWQVGWVINNFHLQWMQIKLVLRSYLIIVYFPQLKIV